MDSTSSPLNRRNGKSHATPNRDENVIWASYTKKTEWVCSQSVLSIRTISTWEAWHLEMIFSWRFAWNEFRTRANRTNTIPALNLSVIVTPVSKVTKTKYLLCERRPSRQGLLEWIWPTRQTSDRQPHTLSIRMTFWEEISVLGRFRGRTTQTIGGGLSRN